MPNVYIAAGNAKDGIARVVSAMRRYLPAYGWHVVDDPKDADLINSHATEIVEGYEHLPVVQSSHGLMWSEYFDHPMWHSVNVQCVKALKRADAVTAPSRWVANAIARGMAVDPTVIYHGVDADEWQPAPSQGYVLWNKARTDEVSDHHAVEKLAALMPDVKFVSTIGTETDNLKICGVQPYAAMKTVIQGAGVYLATARETFGIGTLEALAAGVPVAGWDYGGQSEIIKQGVTGYLAKYGDWDMLADCVHQCFDQRAQLSANCVSDARDRWGWTERIGGYAELFEKTLKLYEREIYLSVPDPKVSVIVTSFNLARFLPDAIRSVETQTMRDFEIIVVDDCSTDDTQRVAGRFSNVRYIRTPHNIGLPAARNYGISHAKGRYVIPLDADDLLTPNALAILSDALYKDKSIHIAYGHIELMSEDGLQRKDSGWPKTDYDWRGQLSHQNQLHYSAMMRRSIFGRTQGYRRRSWQAEDAEFWCYATSFGFNARRVTDEVTLTYRIRHDSKTRANKPMGTEWQDGDWTAWTPYLKYPDSTPFGVQGQLPNGKFWNVSHHATPEVSVIIPVGPKHGTVLQDALDSLLAQSFQNWEVIVVNDSGVPLDLRGYSFATVVETEGQRGTGYARNAGAKVSRAPMLVFLDADDFLQPTFLNDTLTAYKAHGPNALAYTDWYMEQGDGDPQVWKSLDFDCAIIFKQMIYCVTVLHPKSAFEAVGGFDESLHGWEDWDYFIKLALRGLDAIHVVKPLMTYRYWSGARREQAYKDKADLLPLIKNRYKGASEMG